MHGKIAAAEHEYREALRLQPNSGRAQLNLGSLLAGKRDFAGAIEHLQLAAQNQDTEISSQARQALQAISLH